MDVTFTRAFANTLPSALFMAIGYPLLAFLGGDGWMLFAIMAIPFWLAAAVAGFAALHCIVVVAAVVGAHLNLPAQVVAIVVAALIGLIPIGSGDSNAPLGQCLFFLALVLPWVIDCRSRFSRREG